MVALPRYHLSPHSFDMVWIGLFPEQAVKSACYLHGYTTWAF